MSVAHMNLVGRRKDPILSYVTKNDEKKNPGTNGLNLIWCISIKYGENGEAYVEL